MLFFENDYSEGCCPQVLEALVKTNMEPLTPYGSDVYTRQAKEKILASCGCPEGDVFLLVGGTQTNKTVIDAVLKKYEGVVSADTGHIAQHEAGAIESAGHKVLTVPHVDGKLPADGLEALLKTFYDDANHDHMVFPGMVYISHPTEFGTLYTPQELKALQDICKAYDLPLYLDGARLGYGLAAGEATLRDIARYCDVFYIGGTKMGALCGEAIVFVLLLSRLKCFSCLNKRGNFKPCLVIDSKADRVKEEYFSGEPCALLAVCRRYITDKSKKRADITINCLLCLCDSLCRCSFCLCLIVSKSGSLKSLKRAYPLLKECLSVALTDKAVSILSIAKKYLAKSGGGDSLSGGGGGCVSHNKHLLKNMIF